MNEQALNELLRRQNGLRFVKNKIDALLEKGEKCSDEELNQIHLLAKNEKTAWLFPVEFLEEFNKE